MELNKIPPRILSAVRQREHKDSDIVAMTPKKLFAEYCQWNGLINWGDTLWEVMHGLEPKATPVPADFATHKGPWCEGLQYAQTHDLANKDDWQHEQNTFDRAYQELSSKAPAVQPTIKVLDSEPPKNSEFMELVKVTCIWLDSALKCKNFVWDGDQHDAASETLAELKAACSGTSNLLPGAQPKVVVWLEDGVVQGAVADQAVDVAVIQFGKSEDADDRFLVPQTDGTDVEAVGSVWAAKIDQARAAELYEAVEDPRPAASMRP